jgi:hypothetical protein
VLKAALQLFVNACAQRAALLGQAVAALPGKGSVEVGGGISSVLAGPIEIAGNSNISDNHFANVTSSLPAIGVGGGVFANLGPITIDGSTVSGNDATGNGGGIWNGHSLIITNSTVAQNHAALSGGGIFNRGVFSSINTITDNNSPDNIFP